MPASGGLLQSVLKDVESAMLHPNGRTLVFVRGGRLFKDELGGSTPQPVGDPPFPQGNVDGGARFSRDGSRLAVAGAGQLWILPFPSGVPRALAPTMAWDWLPDNRHLLTQVPTMQLQMQLSRVDVDTGASEVVFRSFGAVPQLSVSPDGRRLAVTRGEVGWNVYEVSTRSGATRPFLSGSGVVSWMADWSPSGTRFLVSSNRSGSIAIEDVSGSRRFFAAAGGRRRPTESGLSAMVA